jgi:VanZ family protein
MVFRSQHFPVIFWLHSVTCLALTMLVCWALLTPDPYAVIRTTSLGWLESLADTLMHACVFGVLTLVLLTFSLWLWETPPASVVFGLVGYCVLMEWLQLFVPGRNCDPRDAIANLVGFLFGVACTKAVLLLRFRLLTAGSPA